MKRFILAVIFACSVLTLAAQEGIKVKSRGGKPTISDFAWAYLSDESLLRIEMCFWNEADKKHKLFACCIGGFFAGKYNPGQYDDLVFFRYDNTSKRMVGWDDVGFEVEYFVDGGAYVSYDLPREGKDIVVTKWYDDGPQRKTLRWNGRRFGD